MLQVAPSAYRRHAARQRDPALRSPRARRDVLMAQIQRVFQDHHGVYGADKVWRQLKREGIAVARCTVERLMRVQGLQGVRRGKRVRTTITDEANSRPLDRVNRQFRAARPNTWPSSSMSTPGASSAGRSARPFRAGRAGAGPVRPSARR